MQLFGGLLERDRNCNSALGSIVAVRVTQRPVSVRLQGLHRPCQVSYFVQKIHSHRSRLCLSFCCFLHFCLLLQTHRHDDGYKDGEHAADCLYPSRKVSLLNRRGGRLTRDLHHRRVYQCPGKEAAESKCYGADDQCVAIESILLRSLSHSVFSGSFKAVAKSFALASEPSAFVCLVDLGGWRNSISFTGTHDGLIVLKSADQQYQSDSEEYQQRIESESKNACRFLLDIPLQSFVKSPDCQDHPHDADDETHSENVALPVDGAGDGFGVINGHRCTSNGDSQGPVSSQFEKAFKPITAWLFHFAKVRLVHSNAISFMVGTRHSGCLAWMFSP